MRSLTILFLFMLSGHSLPMAGQKILDPVINPKQYRTDFIDPDIGLSAEFIQCIHEDRFGYLWIGTQYGLDRWDGYKVTRMGEVKHEGSIVPMEWIWSIDEDPQGNLWVCSSRGLFRYDRAREAFSLSLPNRDQPGSVDNQVWSIKQDSRERYWVFTRGGLFGYQIETDSFKDYKKDSVTGRERFFSWNELAWYHERRFREDPSGDLWFATRNGLKRYDPEKDRFTTYRHEPGNPRSLETDLVSCIELDQNGSLWASTYDEEENKHGLHRLIDPEKGIFKRYQFDPSDPGSRVSEWMWCMHLSRAGELWIGGRTGFCRYNASTDDFTSYRLPDRIEFTQPIQNIAEDSQGRLWMIRTRSGLVCFEPATEEVYEYLYNPEDPNNLVPDYNLWNIRFGRNDVLWTSALTRIARSDPRYNPFHTTLTRAIKDDPNCDDVVLSTHYDPDGTLWIGGEFGLYQSTGFLPGGSNKFNHVTPTWVWDLSRDYSGRMWLGGTPGFGKLNEEKMQIRWHRPSDHPDSLISGSVHELLCDSRNLIWVLPWQPGINIFSPEHDRFISIRPGSESAPGLGEINHYHLNEDRNGDLWFGSFEEGLCRLDMSGGLADSIREVFKGNITQDQLKFRYKHYLSSHRDPNSLSCNQVVNIYTDTSGRLWIGTTNGLNLYDEQQDLFYRYSTADGLPDPSIMGILEDDHGNLWLSSKEGICKVVLAEGVGPDLIQSVHPFREEDGLQGNMFYEKSCDRSPEGWMVFGGKNGFTVFHPDSIQDNPIVPPVYITDIKINDRSIHSEEHDVLEAGLSETNKILLPHKENTLSIEYLALNYKNAAQNQYRYIMEGLDDDWVEAGTRRFADYRNMRPGSYTFRLMGSNDDGVWNEQGASIGIVIRPPWYRTLLAYVMYLVVVLLILWGYIRRRTYLLKKENRRLDEMVRERTRTIEDQNERIMTVNAELEEQKEEVLAVNEELKEQREEIMTVNAHLEEQKEELIQQKEELQVTLDRLKETQAQLIQSEKMAALGGLVAGVAHEINTPVGISLTAASSLEDETRKMADLYKEDKISRADFKDFLNTANQSAKLILSNMQRTAEMVQSFKQVSSDQSTAQQRKFHLKSYTEDVIRSLYPKLKRRKIRIELKIDEKLEMDSFPGAFSQIITNLVLNSLRHAFGEEEEGNIRIDSKIENGMLILNFSDNGKGMPMDILDRIYEPFFTTDKKIGTGLGMHIVYNLVTQKLNGSIACESKPKEGTRFLLKIPLNKNQS